MIFDISYISFFDANHFIALCRLLDMSTTECEYFFFRGTFWVHFLIKFITRFLSNLNRGLSNREIDFNFLYDRR